MTKYSLAALLLLVLAAPIFADHFSCLVVDKKTQNPLPMTNINLTVNNDGLPSSSPVKFAFFTDNLGKLDFDLQLTNNLSPESYDFTLSTSKIGYQSSVIKGIMASFPPKIELAAILAPKLPSTKKLIKLNLINK